MSDKLKLISPVDGSIYVERPLASAADVDATFTQAAQAQNAWKRVPLKERAALLGKFIDAFVALSDDIVPELAWQMGRPIAYGAGEVKGFEDRARYMISIAEEALAPVRPAPIDGFDRYIKRDPLGVIFTIAAWNFPYLIAVNSVVPALMAGNTVVLKHSGQTPLCAERMMQAFEQAGAPDALFQILHMDHDLTSRAIQHPACSYVAFTGSVAGGHAIQQAAVNRFIGVGLELGGKDPSYVRADADIAFTVENLVDGAFFNSGQSCCGQERIYVAAEVYDTFVEQFVELTKGYRLGDPLDADTTIGPMVRTRAATFVRGQIADAVRAGAKSLIPESHYAMSKEGSPYLGPQVLVDVDHSMDIMTEETFGPAVGIVKVAGDEEALRLMNDSRYGLTASIWTTDVDAAKRIGDDVETGTWFMNRCDYLDPALTWTGVKDSGRGATLSSVGYEFLTRPKSYHLRMGK
ncbi:MAG: aldehyde dehydrogenase [Rhodobiaceae bacterium]|nr:MAG: aldehyde dehydrogenase [Rhodobiaceae bacterium]